MPATIRLRQHEATRPAPADALSCARRARWTTHFLLLPLVLLLGACELGGSAGGAASEVAGASSIDLPPGQTEATLAWTPSSGDVDNYSVYESRISASKYSRRGCNKAARISMVPFQCPR